MSTSRIARRLASSSALVSGQSSSAPRKIVLVGAGFLGGWVGVSGVSA
jgi:hypothetical protein